MDWSEHQRFAGTTSDLSSMQISVHNLKDSKFRSKWLPLESQFNWISVHNFLIVTNVINFYSNLRIPLDYF
jgi:hypothetical protein